MTIKKLKFQKLEKQLILSSGLKKVLGTKSLRMNRMEIFSRLLEKMHFLKLNHVLTSKNYRLPPSWQRALKCSDSFVDEKDLFKIIALNSK